MSDACSTGRRAPRPCLRGPQPTCASPPSRPTRRPQPTCRGGLIRDPSLCLSPDKCVARECQSIEIHIQTLLPPEDNKFGFEDERGQTISESTRRTHSAVASRGEVEAAEPIARERVGAALRHERSQLISSTFIFAFKLYHHYKYSSELNNGSTVPAHVSAERRPLIGGDVPSDETRARARFQPDTTTEEE